MRKKALISVLSASIMCAAAAVTLAACGEDEATKYKVTYQGGGTAVTGTAPTEADHAKDEKFKLKDNTFTYTDHVFDGWIYGEQTLEAGAEFTMPEKDVTFTAKWLELFTVTYEWGAEKPAGAAADTTLPQAVEIADGKTVTLPTLTPATGYEFKGWLIDTATTEQAGGTTYTVTKDVTATAVFAANAYDVTYSLGEHAADGQEAPSTEQKAYGSIVQLPATDPTAASGFVFTGWEVKQGATKVKVEDNSFTMPNGAVTVTATWADAANVYTVTFYKDEGDTTAYATLNAVQGGTLSSLPTLPEKTGYRFEKWVTKDGATETDFTMNTVISANTSVYAKWIEQVTVTFSLGEGNANHAAADTQKPVRQIVDKNEEINLTIPRAAEGYEFAGWKVGDTEVVLAADATKYAPTETVTLTAQWTEKSYTIVFLANETDTTGKSVTYKYFDKLSAGEGYAETKNADGFAVKEWAVKDHADVKANAETVANTLKDNAAEGTITLYPLSYHLKINAKDGAIADSEYDVMWKNTIQQGQVVTLSGHMTSDTTDPNNAKTVWAYVFSGATPTDLYRIDWAHIGTAEAGCTISNDIGPTWGDNPQFGIFQTSISDATVTIKIDFTHSNKIIVRFDVIGTKNSDVHQVMQYTITNSGTFANTMNIGLGGWASHTEITTLDRHTHDYSPTTDQCECGQVNPVHTVHQWQNGVCSVCKAICAHEGATDAACSVCGATLTKSTLTVDNTNWWASNTSSDKRVDIAAGETLVLNMQYSNFTAAEWAGAILTIRNGETLVHQIRYIDGWEPGTNANYTVTEGTTMVHNTDDNASLPGSRLQIIVSLSADGRMRMICNKYASDDANLETVLATRILECTGVNVENVKFGISSADGSAFVSDNVNVVKATYTA